MSFSPFLFFQTPHPEIKYASDYLLVLFFFCPFPIIFFKTKEDMAFYYYISTR